MSRRWLGVVLLAGWLGVSASARAQDPMPHASGDLPPHANDDVPPHGTPPAPAPVAAPGSGGPGWYPPFSPVPPPVDGPMPSGEVVPPNSFSNVHPEQVGRSPRFYIGADYLLWYVRKDQVPTLATAGNVNDAVPAALGQPSTKTLIGPGGFGAPSASGARVTAFYWFDQDHTLGLDASGFWMNDAMRQAVVGGTGDVNGQVVARPFFNPNFNTQDSDPVSVPSVLSGGLVIRESRSFMGAEANARYSLCVDCGPVTRVTFLAGGRWLYLDEALNFVEQVNELPDSLGTPGNTFNIAENFNTYNRYYGGQIGLETESRVGPVVLTVAAKVGCGETYETVKTGAGTRVTEPDGTVIVDPTRGLLVQPSNLGRSSTNKFSVVPELAANLAWEFNEHFRVSVGYNFLFWSSVLRPGETIDPVVSPGAVGDVGQLGVAGRPSLVLLHSTDFWAQG
ncbi:MAG TPA: BBP7 family outer membrane beta-barrel protein, partial [Gemmataceae bacterium]|nr:BBP7 family outer membrane beta-barrel protein [Gemmataceae bacterium]